MSDEATSFDIASKFVVMDRNSSAKPVKVTERFWADLEKDFGDFAGMSLISCFNFEEDWPTWEIHRKGDEFVCLCPATSR